MLKYLKTIMTYNDNGYKYKDYFKWESKKQAPYNYEGLGLIRHLLSNRIVNTNNSVLKIVLNYYEKSIIYMLKYVDRLKNFKNYHWKNR